MDLHRARFVPAASRWRSLGVQALREPPQPRKIATIRLYANIAISSSSSSHVDGPTSNLQSAILPGAGPPGAHQDPGDSRPRGSLGSGAPESPEAGPTGGVAAARGSAKPGHRDVAEAGVVGALRSARPGRRPAARRGPTHLQQPPGGHAGDAPRASPGDPARLEWA